MNHGRTRGLLGLYLLALGCGTASQGAAPATSAGSESARGGSESSGATDGTRGLRVVSAGAQDGAAPNAQTPGERVRVRIEVSRAGQPVEFRPGSTTLRSGDRIVMYVRSDRDGWLNVVQFFPDHTSAVLSSSDGSAVQARAGEETRIPAGSDQIELDDVTGEENLYVVASARPLAEVDQTVSRLVDAVRTSGSPTTRAAGARPARPHERPHAANTAPSVAPSAAPSAPASAPAPDLLAGLSRGMRVVPARSGGVETEGEADARGITVLHVGFRHE